MARSRGGSFRSRSGVSRRKTSWTVGPGSGTGGSAQSITTSSAVLMGATAVVAVDGITMVRTRGEFNAFLTAAAGAPEGFFGAFGIAVASSAAVAAGVASVPTPIAEESWDGWLYHRYFSTIAGGVVDGTAATDDVQVNATSAALRLEIDSKAMRKLEIAQTIYAAVEVALTGTATLRVFMNSRILVKLA